MALEVHPRIGRKEVSVRSFHDVQESDYIKQETKCEDTCFGFVSCSLCLR